MIPGIRLMNQSYYHQKKDDKYKNLYHELEGRLIALQHEKDYLVDQYNECQREVL